MGLAVMLTAALTLAGCGDRDVGKVYGHARWVLAAVSADGRTLTIQYNGNLCPDRVGEPVVYEDAFGVEIVLPLIKGRPDRDERCMRAPASAAKRVRLTGSLGRRELTQPAGGPRAVVTVRRVPDVKDCAQLEALPKDSTAQDIPWVAERLRSCTTAVSPAVARLPLMRRARTAKDRLPAIAFDTLRLSPHPLRPARSRRLRTQAPAWLVPRVDDAVCLWTESGGQPACADVAEIRRRGLAVHLRCRVVLPDAVLQDYVGLAPSRVSRLIVRPYSSTTRTVRVRDGAWEVRGAAAPLRISGGGLQLPTTRSGPYEPWNMVSC